jgi:hypothetical protein
VKLGSWDRDAARRAWDASGNIRVPGFFADDQADRLAGSLATQAFELTRSSDDMYQYWRSDLYFEEGCDHPLCALGRWLRDDAPAILGGVTGIPLGPAPEPIVSGNAYGKGSFLDTHNDFGKGRAVAFVLGFTREPWDASEGGWLEFLDRGRAWGDVTPAERDSPDVNVLCARPPGWNTLDLFDVRGPDRWHRVTILRTHRLRTTISGWLYPASGSGGSADG